MLKSDKIRYNLPAAAGLLLALLMVAVAAIVPAAAANPPNPWETEWLWGTVTINGVAAPAGTPVSVYVNGTYNAATTVDGFGKYGDTTQFYITGSDGQAITFKVGATDVPEPAVFAGGTTARVNLAVVTTALSVTTNDASPVGSRTATLNGNLTNKGGYGSVIVYFKYGTTTACTSRTDNQTRTATGAFTANISGLTPDTPYYVQAVVIGGSSTVNGNQVTFNTSQTTLSVTTNAATVPTASSATLNGNLADLGANTTVNVYFEYGTDENFGATTPLQAKPSVGAFTANLSGLLSNTKYYFRAVAAGATTVYGSMLDFTTSVGTLGVATGGATLVSATTANLNGTLTGLGLNPSATVYFKYGTNATTYGSTTPNQAQTSVGGFSAPISDLSPGTTYHFQAVAIAGGTTVTGADANFTTLAGGGSASPPHQFYGTVYVGGSRATEGMTVTAYLNGLSAASTTTDSSGRYGYASLFYVPGTGSGTVTFYVSSVLVPQTATWAGGDVSKLDLYSTQTPVILTCAATTVSATAATLTGTVTSLGTGDTSAAVSFEWGTSPTVLTPVTATPTAITTPPGSFTASRTGLTAGALYYYRAKAVGNASGTVYCPASGANTYIYTLPLNITTPCPLSPAAVVNVAYSKTFAATGGSGTGYTWTLTRGTLPAAFTLSTGGVLSGTATVAGGPYSFTVQVTDSLGVTATKTCELTVNVVSALNITTPSPLSPDATVNVLYTKTFAASGGSGTGYTWTLTRGTLPAAFTLSTGGVLSGTATVEGGPYSFTVRVTDSLSAQFSKNFLLTVGTSPCGSDPVGCTVGTANVRTGKYNFVLTKFTATDSATINKIKLVGKVGDGSVPGTGKAAIYADNAGQVGARLGYTENLAPVNVGLNTIPLDHPCAVIAGRVYWLAFWCTSSIGAMTIDPGGVWAYTETTASFTFPETISGTMYYSTYYKGLIAGTN